MEGVHPLDTAVVDAYLRRLGARRPSCPEPEVLAELQRRHLVRVPFENLAIHLGEEISLDAPSLAGKVALTSRGGICYELNGAFAALLVSLGYQVTLLAGRVYDAQARLGPPYDHLALRVGVPGVSGSWLVDVGFGQFSSRPLDFDERDVQRDRSGLYRLAETGDGDLDLFGDGLPRYRLEQRPRALQDFEATCWWHRTSPRSLFTRGPLCTRHTEDGGRITLSGRRLTHTRPDGARREEALPDEAALLAAYREHFGIALDRDPAAMGPPSSTAAVRPATAHPTGGCGSGDEAAAESAPSTGPSNAGTPSESGGGEAGGG